MTEDLCTSTTGTTPTSIQILGITGAACTPLKTQGVPDPEHHAFSRRDLRLLPPRSLEYGAAVAVAAKAVDEILVVSHIHSTYEESV